MNCDDLIAKVINIINIRDNFHSAGFVYSDCINDYKSTNIKSLEFSSRSNHKSTHIDKHKMKKIIEILKTFIISGYLSHTDVMLQ